MKTNWRRKTRQNKTKAASCYTKRGGVFVFVPAPFPPLLFNFALYKRPLLVNRLPTNAVKTV